MVSIICGFIFGSWFMVHGSWFMVHGSWFMVHGSWFIGGYDNFLESAFYWSFFLGHADFANAADEIICEISDICPYPSTGPYGRARIGRA
jgi:hypothetical protein